MMEADEGEKMSPEAHVDGRGMRAVKERRQQGERRKRKRRRGCLEGERRILSRMPGCMQGLEIEWTPAGAPGAQKAAG